MDFANLSPWKIEGDSLAEGSRNTIKIFGIFIHNISASRPQANR